MRVVSLCPSLTELVFELNRGDNLVGRTRFCVHPAGAVDVVERVGGTKNPKVSRIIELAPDLVLMNEEENRREDAEALRRAGLAIHTSMPRSAADTAAMVRELAVLLGAEDRGRVLAARIEEAAARVAALAASRPRVRYAYLIWRDPIMAAGSGTYIEGILGEAGGENAFAGSGDRYPTITSHDLARAEVDVVFLSSEPFPFGAAHVAELGESTGLPAERFRLVDGELLSWHGARTVAGLDYAGELMASVGAR